MVLQRSMRPQPYLTTIFHHAYVPTQKRYTPPRQRGRTRGTTRSCHFIVWSHNTMQSQQAATLPYMFVQITNTAIMDGVERRRHRLVIPGRVVRLKHYNNTLLLHTHKCSNKFARYCSGVEHRMTRRLS